MSGTISLALALPSPAQLEIANQQAEAKIVDGKLAEEAIRESDRG